MVDGIKRTLVLATVVIGLLSYFMGQRSLHGQNPAHDGNPLAKWRPSQDNSGIKSVGSSTCALCHTYQASTQLTTKMAHALVSVADSEVLAKRPQLIFKNSPYTYQITRRGDQSYYTVSDGLRTISEPILYCFGQGKVSQVYIFRHDGFLYESRVSYYRGIDGLDFTVRQPRSVPTSLDGALGRPLGESEARKCFGCHSTAAVSGNQLRLERLIHGVSCEACHGPGEQHIGAIKAKNFKDRRIFNPATLNALELTQEFCGSCHMSFDQVMLLPGQDGLNNVRFQPYRMFNSRGHNKNDSRLSCTACHDPHDNPEHEAAFYDAKCLACHLSGLKDIKTEARTAAPCPVGTRQCVTCHMPKVTLPDMHADFTDHWIRVVKPGDPIPR